MAGPDYLESDEMKGLIGQEWQVDPKDLPQYQDVEDDLAAAMAEENSGEVAVDPSWNDKAKRFFESIIAKGQQHIIDGKDYKNVFTNQQFKDWLQHTEGEKVDMSIPGYDEFTRKSRSFLDGLVKAGRLTYIESAQMYMLPATEVPPAPGPKGEKSEDMLNRIYDQVSLKITEMANGTDINGPIIDGIINRIDPNAASAYYNKATSDEGRIFLRTPDHTQMAERILERLKSTRLIENGKVIGGIETLSSVGQELEVYRDALIRQAPTEFPFEEGADKLMAAIVAAKAKDELVTIYQHATGLIKKGEKKWTPESSAGEDDSAELEKKKTQALKAAQALKEHADQLYNEINRQLADQGKGNYDSEVPMPVYINLNGLEGKELLRAEVKNLTSDLDYLRAVSDEFMGVLRKLGEETSPEAKLAKAKQDLIDEIEDAFNNSTAFHGAIEAATSEAEVAALAARARELKANGEHNWTPAPAGENAAQKAERLALEAAVRFDEDHKVILRKIEADITEATVDEDERFLNAALAAYRGIREQAVKNILQANGIETAFNQLSTRIAEVKRLKAEHGAGGDEQEKANKRQEVKEKIGQYTTYRCHEIFKAVFEGVTPPPNNPFSGAVVSINLAEEKKKYTDNGGTDWDKLYAGGAGFAEIKAEKEAAFIANLKKVVEKVVPGPKTPEGLEIGDLSEAANANAKQLVENLLMTLKTGERTEWTAPDGKVHKSRLRLGKPEEVEAATGLTQMKDRKFDGNDVTLTSNNGGTTTTNPDGSTTTHRTWKFDAGMVDAMRYGKMIAESEDQDAHYEAFRGALGLSETNTLQRFKDADGKESIKKFLESKGVHDLGNGFNYTSAEKNIPGKVPADVYDQGYCVDAWGGGDGKWISTADLFSEILYSGEFTENSGADTDFIVDDLEGDDSEEGEGAGSGAGENGEGSTAEKTAEQKAFNEIVDGWKKYLATLEPKRELDNDLELALLGRLLYKKGITDIIGETNDPVLKLAQERWKILQSGGAKVDIDNNLSQLMDGVFNHQGGGGLDDKETDPGSKKPLDVFFDDEVDEAAVEQDAGKAKANVDSLIRRARAAAESSGIDPNEAFILTFLGVVLSNIPADGGESYVVALRNELSSRINYMDDKGVGYVSMDSAAKIFNELMPRGTEHAATWINNMPQISTKEMTNDKVNDMVETWRVAAEGLEPPRDLDDNLLRELYISEIQGNKDEVLVAEIEERIKDLETKGVEKSLDAEIDDIVEAIRQAAA